MTLGHRNWFQRLSRGDRIAVMTASAVVVVVLGLLTLVLGEERENTQVDPATFCPEAGATAHVVVLIDRTDPLTPSQARAARKVILDIKDNIAVGERVSIHEIDPSGTGGLSESILSTCKPRDGTDANRLYESPQLIENRFRREFGEPIEETLQTTLSGGGAPRSPIIESIADVALLDEFGDDMQRRQLIIFSDLMQHTEAFSHYRYGGEFKEFRNTSSGQALIPDLSGVSVELYYLLRFDNGDLVQPADHIRFWDRLFQDAQAASLTITKVR